MRYRITEILRVGALAALLTATGTAMASAQSADGRWLPFVGCWEAVGGEDEIGLLCFEQQDGGVLLSNFVDGEVASTEFFAADGQQRPVSAEGCEGWEATRFSTDGRRIFTETEFNCGTEEVRRGTGVMAFVAPNMWSDIRTLDVDGEPVAWVQDYRLASRDVLVEEGVEDPAADLGMAVRAARMSAAAPIDLDDVEEALQVMDPRGVETWLVAQDDELDPSADDLVRLADSGVPDQVIDAIVAVSYPEQFVVAADGDIETHTPRATHYRGYMAYSPFWRTRWGLGYAPFGWAFGYDPYYYGGYGYRGYGYSYGYGGPWGYRPYGYGYYGSRPGTIIISRDGGGSVVNGRGYRRGGSTSDGAAARRGATPSYRSPGARSTGRSARPSSGRSGGSDSGRRAVRRPSGGSAQSSQSSSAPRGAVRRPPPSRSAPAARSNPPRRAPAASRPSTPRRAPAARSGSGSSSRGAARGTARRRGGR